MWRLGIARVILLDNSIGIADSLDTSINTLQTRHCRPPRTMLDPTDTRQCAAVEVHVWVQPRIGGSPSSMLVKNESFTVLNETKRDDERFPQELLREIVKNKYSLTDVHMVEVLPCDTVGRPRSSSDELRLSDVAVIIRESTP